MKCIVSEWSADANKQERTRETTAVCKQAVSVKMTIGRKKLLRIIYGGAELIKAALTK